MGSIEVSSFQGIGIEGFLISSCWNNRVGSTSVVHRGVLFQRGSTIAILNTR